MFTRFGGMSTFWFSDMAKECELRRKQLFFSKHFSHEVHQTTAELGHGFCQESYCSLRLAFDMTSRDFRALKSNAVASHSISK